MTTSICEYCNKEISKQNMRKHQKTQTCKKFQVPVLSDFDKEIMRLCEENEKEVNSDYESDSDKSSDKSSDSEYLDYDMLDIGGILQIKDILRKKRQVVSEDEHLLQLKKTNQIPSRNWKHGLVLMSRYDPEDDTVCHSNDELEMMGGYASDSSHESYHGDGIFSHFSKTTQLHSDFYRE